MPKKRSSRVTTRKKKKSWWSIFFVLAIATVIGLPISYNMTKNSSQTASNSNSKIAAVLSPVTKSLLLTTTSTCSGQTVYGSATYVCTNGKLGTITKCADANTFAIDVYNVCSASSGTTPTPKLNITYPTANPTKIANPTPKPTMIITPTPKPNITYPTANPTNTVR